MNPAPKAFGVRLSALHAATFAGVGVQLPFFPVWLESRALDPAVIGLILAIPIIVRILVMAPLLAWADRSLGLRRLLLVGHTAQIALYPVLFLVDKGWMIGALVALLAVAQATIIPGNDLATIEAVRRDGRLRYGRLRVWGSIAFLGTSIAAGYLVDLFGTDLIIWALLSAPLLGILATGWALPVRRSAEAPRPAAGSEKVRFPAVLFVIVIGAAMIQGSHGAIYAFGSIHWRSIGFPESVIGYLWAIGVVAEIGVFYLFGHGVGRGSAGLGLIVTGGAAAILRNAVLSMDPGLAATFALQALHGLSFGATHLGTMATLAALAPEAARGRAQGLGGSLIALATAATTVASGPIYRAFGAGVFAAMVPLCAVGLLFIAVGARMLRAYPQRSGVGG
jgi:PPP family 3-phenylpropionic acid transporter